MITAMPRIAIAVTDFNEAVTTFERTFGLPVIDISENSVESLGAKLAMCVPKGGSNIELMCPENHEAPLSQSLDRFLGRRGQGLFALMLEAPVPDEEAQVLIEQGLNVLPLMEGAGGRDIHPKSTHGVLIRIYPENSFQGDTRDSASGLSGITRVMIAVRDLATAMNVYGDKLGLGVDAPVVDEARGIKSAVCHPPTGGVIELTSVEDSERPFAAMVRQVLDERGEGLFALVLQADDLEKVAGALAEQGQSFDRSPGYLETRAFGANIIIEAAKRRDSSSW